MCLPNSAVEGAAKRMRTSYDLQPSTFPPDLPDPRYQASLDPSDRERIQRSLLFWREGGGGRPSYDIAEGERTSNSGSIIADNQMCVGPSGGEVTEISFPGVTPRVEITEGVQSWRVQSVESCTRGYPSNGADMKLARGGENDDEMEHMSMDNSGTNEDETEYSGGKLEMDLSSGQSKLCPRGHWRPAEDEKLRELVSQYGPQNWNLIAEKIQGRSGKSCRLRWFNQLDPRINRRPFTEEEEEKLLAAHHFHGNKWAMIARLFPGRTDNGVKNHYHVVESRKKKTRAPPPSPHGRQARKNPPPLSRRGRRSTGTVSGGLNISQHTAADSLHAWLEKYSSPSSDIDSVSLSSQFDGTSPQSLKPAMMLNLPKVGLSQPMLARDIDNGLSPSVNSGLLSRAAEALAEKGSFVGLKTSQQGGLYAGAVAPHWFVPSLLTQGRVTAKEESERSSTTSSPFGSTCRSASASELQQPQSPYVNENNPSSSNSSRQTLSSQLWVPETRAHGATGNGFDIQGKVQGSDSSQSSVLHRDLGSMNPFTLSCHANQQRDSLQKETVSTASWVTVNDQHYVQESQPEVAPSIQFIDFLGVGA